MCRSSDRPGDEVHLSWHARRSRSSARRSSANSGEALLDRDARRAQPLRRAGTGRALHRAGVGDGHARIRGIWWCASMRCRPADSYAVMPGGLTRVSASLDTMVVSMQRGGGSKDTWVLGDGPAAALHAAASARPSPRCQPRHLRSFQPRGRQSVLAGPLHRTRRSYRANHARYSFALLAGRGRHPRLRFESGPEILAALGYIEEKNRAAAEQEVLPMIYDPAESSGLVWNFIKCAAWPGCCAIASQWTPG